MEKNIFNTPIWKRLEKSGLVLEQLHKDTKKLREDYAAYFDNNIEWIKKFQALNNTVVTTGSVPGIDPVQNEMRNETIFSIADLGSAAMSVMKKMTSSDTALFNEIIGNTKVFKETAKFLRNNSSQTKACEAKVQAAEASLEKALQNYEVLKGHLKIVTDTLEKQKAQYFKVVN